MNDLKKILRLLIKNLSGATLVHLSSYLSSMLLEILCVLAVVVVLWYLRFLRLKRRSLTQHAAHLSHLSFPGGEGATFLHGHMKQGIFPCFDFVSIGRAVVSCKNTRPQVAKDGEHVHPSPSSHKSGNTGQYTKLYIHLAQKE